ncbi:DedA family protein [Pseudoruegeria sp. SHC-113]|uniref:DedA family protein n=1 Tax=Pseudoruegeria sp. SHC-113 TaxID=2855439 RepID=UPI0021BAA009|nr:DedA family protein [Pseudoruegeria sp. SHC-113]MCT8159629.1 DedA family protein [Pseudoruegeria sp. SHC-113]
MTETIFALVTQYGSVVIMASAFLSCLLLPIPTSLMMLTGGAFVASGDLDPLAVGGAAFLGAVLGDQAGYLIGRRGGAVMLQRLARSPARAAALGRAQALVARRGGIGVFLSTWALAPLGPWVNFASGAAGLSWRRFTLWDVAGEAIWVTLYVGLGYLFMDQVSYVADVMGNVIGFLVALAVAGAMALWIRAVLRAKEAGRARGLRPATGATPQSPR